MHPHQSFWTWFIRHLARTKQIIIPNFGTFTLSSKNDRWYIRFKMTGRFQRAYFQRSQSYWFGEEDAIQNALLWGPVIQRSKSLHNLSLLRQLIWHYAQHMGYKVHAATRIVYSVFQEAGDKILREDQVHLTAQWSIHCSQRHSTPAKRGLYSQIDSDYLFKLVYNARFSRV